MSDEELKNALRQIIHEEISNAMTDSPVLRSVIRQEMITILSRLLGTDGGTTSGFFRGMYGYSRYKIGTRHPGYFG